MDVNTCTNCNTKYVFNPRKYKTESHKLLCWHCETPKLFTCKESLDHHIKETNTPGFKNKPTLAAGNPFANIFKKTYEPKQPNISNKRKADQTKPTVDDELDALLSFIFSDTKKSDLSKSVNPDLSKSVNPDLSKSVNPNMVLDNFTTSEPANKRPALDNTEHITTYSQPNLNIQPDGAATIPAEIEQANTNNIPFEWIGDDIKDITDLIRLGKTYDKARNIQTNIDLDKLSNLVEPLQELDKMVGLTSIKSKIFDMIIFHLQNLDVGNKDMNHTIIKGPPGVGKTNISHIIANIYKSLGILNTNNIISIKIDDLVADYLGQTAGKARKKLESALGGVLFIDEAYSLGDINGKDSYKRDALDILTSFLSEHGNEFVCIIAGYKDALEKQFFSMNAGLARRFCIHYEIEPYTHNELLSIFKKICLSAGTWSIVDSPPELADIFSAENMVYFPHFGGDCSSLFSYCKKAHAKRLLTIKTKNELDKNKNVLSGHDILTGFELYKQGTNYKITPDDTTKNKTDDFLPVQHIYS